MGNQQGSAAKATEANQRNNTSTSRQPLSPSSVVDHPLLQLQQVIGNRAIGRVIQTKLNVSRPGDQYEQEADRMAEMVMRMPDGEAPGISRSSTQIQRQCSDCASGGGICPKCAEESSLQLKPLAGTIAPIIQRRCNECEEEEETLQFKRSPGHTPKITPTVAANIDALRGGGQPLPPSTRAFFEPRFGYDFSDVRVHTNGRAAETAQQVSAQAFTVGRDIVFGAGHYNPETQPGRQLLAHELTHVVQQTPLLSRKSSLIQRMPENSSPTLAEAEPSQETSTPTEEVTPTPAETTEETAEARETSTPGLLVEDSADELTTGQMKKSEFLAELRTDVCSAAEEVLASSGQTTDGCPYLDYWFDFYGNKDSQHIERAIQRYAPEASSAATARDYIPIITARVRRGVESWARTGEITGVPEGVPTQLPGAGSGESAGETASAAGRVSFKSRAGGPREAGNPQAIRAQLGRGRPLDGSVRSRMESVFGARFSHVRVHTDAGAAQLSDRFNARAFTVGEHVAFGSGEYHPGTPIGDAIIAHELAHVLQQGGSDSFVTPMRIGDTGYNALENDADLSAVGAVASLWGGTKGILKDVARNAMPRLKSGVRLQRCGRGVCCPKTGFPKVTHTGTTANATTAFHSFNMVVEYEVDGTKNGDKECSVKCCEFRQVAKGYWKENGVEQTLQSSGSGLTLNNTTYQDDGYSNADDMDTSKYRFRTNDNPGWEAGQLTAGADEEYYLNFEARAIDTCNDDAIRASKSGYWIKIMGKHPRTLTKGGF
jgi:hypothetical protein